MPGAARCRPPVVPCRGALRCARTMELPDVRAREPGESQGERGIERSGLGVHLDGGAERIGIAGTVEVVVASEIEVVGSEILGRLGRHRLVIRLLQRQVQCGCDLLRDLRLDLEHLLDRLVVAPGPEVAVVAHADELGRHPDPARPAGLFPPHAPLEHVVHTQLAADVLEGLAGLPVLLRAGARDDAQPADHRQPVGDLLGDAVAEVAVLGGPQVVERKHGDPG